MAEFIGDNPLVGDFRRFRVAFHLLARRPSVRRPATGPLGWLSIPGPI